MLHRTAQRAVSKCLLYLLIIGGNTCEWEGVAAPVCEASNDGEGCVKLAGFGRAASPQGRLQ